jgi:hypothetical protein
MQRHASPARRRERLRAVLATVFNPVERVGAAAEYARAALKTNPDPDVAADLEKRLIAAGDLLYGLYERRRSS